MVAGHVSVRAGPIEAQTTVFAPHRTIGSHRSDMAGAWRSLSTLDPVLGGRIQSALNYYLSAGRGCQEANALLHAPHASSTPQIALRIVRGRQRNGAKVARRSLIIETVYTHGAICCQLTTEPQNPRGDGNGTRQFVTPAYNGMWRHDGRSRARPWRRSPRRITALRVGGNGAVCRKRRSRE